MIRNLLITLLLIAPSVFADGDYSKHFAELESLLGEINGFEKTIREEIEEKNHTQDKEKVKELFTSIKALLKKRKDVVEKYQLQYHHIRYEHPEKGHLFESKYKKIDARHEKEFENEIDSLLSGLVTNVRKKYPIGEKNGN